MSVSLAFSSSALAQPRLCQVHGSKQPPSVRGNFWQGFRGELNSRFHRYNVVLEGGSRFSYWGHLAFTFPDGTIQSQASTLVTISKQVALFTFHLRGKAWTEPRLLAHSRHSCSAGNCYLGQAAIILEHSYKAIL